MIAMRQIRDLSRRIAGEFNPERIILFGAYASGKPAEDSDVDLLVVLPHRGLAARKSAEIRLRLRPRYPGASASKADAMDARLRCRRVRRAVRAVLLPRPTKG